MIFTDLQMPRMDGMELFEEVRKLKKDQIVVVVTGYGTVATAKLLLKNGCFDYITKPFDVEHINGLIERIVKLQEHTENPEIQGSNE